MYKRGDLSLGHITEKKPTLLLMRILDQWRIITVYFSNSAGDVWLLNSMLIFSSSDLMSDLWYLVPLSFSFPFLPLSLRRRRGEHILLFLVQTVARQSVEHCQYRPPRIREDRNRKAVNAEGIEQLWLLRTAFVFTTTVSGPVSLMHQVHRESSCAAELSQKGLL